jgi:hypothetical protein
LYILYSIFWSGFKYNFKNKNITITEEKIFFAITLATMEFSGYPLKVQQLLGMFQNHTGLLAVQQLHPAFLQQSRDATAMQERLLAMCCSQNIQNSSPNRQSAGFTIDAILGNKQENTKTKSLLKENRKMNYHTENDSQLATVGNNCFEPLNFSTRSNPDFRLVDPERPRAVYPGLHRKQQRLSPEIQYKQEKEYSNTSLERFHGENNRYF